MGQKVKIGIIGGSGLDNPKILENRVEKAVETPYGNPSDDLIEGKIQGVDCVLLARHGRKHTISPSNVNYRANIWALRSVGCTHVIASTACGSLEDDIRPGDLLLIESFIDRTRTRIQTFYDGSDLAPAGVCHLPMEPAFCLATRKILLQAAAELQIDIHPTGTCVIIEGPRYSSLAESKLFKSWGCQLVNMTLVPEVVLAKEAGLCYASVAMATDYDCWQTDGNKVCVEEVMRTFKDNADKVIKLFNHVVPLIAEQNWDETIAALQKTVESNIMIPAKDGCECKH